MEVALLRSCCETSWGHAMASSESIRSCVVTVMAARENSSSMACSSFSCVQPSSWKASCGAAFREVRQRHDESHGRGKALFSSLAIGLRCSRQLEGQGLHQWRVYGMSRQFWRPVVARSRGGGPRLPGKMGPDGRPQHGYVSPPGLGQFRPPPTGYVPEYEESEEERQSAAIKKDLLLEKLKVGPGSWQERAAFIKELQQLDVTSEELYSLTFITIVEQLEIVVAAQVYESLVQSGTCTEILQRFDEFSLSLLYALRTLSAGQRRSAAEYVMEKSLSVEEAQELAWAIKDHERRPSGRQGFTTEPGDCLAFMYHRQAIESQQTEIQKAHVDLGLKAAVTDSAKQRFSEFS